MTKKYKKRQRVNVSIPLGTVLRHVIQYLQPLVTIITRTPNQIDYTKLHDSVHQAITL